jgi:hypothetical protein
MIVAKVSCGARLRGKAKFRRIREPESFILLEDIVKQNRLTFLTLGQSRTFMTMILMAFAVLLPFLVAPNTFAQTDLASIRGTVQDQTGAAIPAATIKLISLDTGLTQTTVADATGNFHFEALVRGNYQTTVTVKGFETQTESLRLDVSQIQALNFRLKPGAATTTVTVTDAAPIVDTTTSSTGNVVESEQIAELPLNGRNYTQLALLVPGVTRGAYGSDASGASGNSETWRGMETGGSAISANGLRQEANNFELDGLDNNEGLVNSTILITPVENMEEFRVTTSVAPAEFGKAGGAILQNSIKSGTNHYHGSIFFFDRDQIFNASPNYFSPSTPAGTFHKAQFGGTGGGPIPFLHNKLFIFGGYQGLRFTTPDGEATNTVATPLMRTGDFSELLSTPNFGWSTGVPNQQVTGCNTTAGPNGTIYDPTTCLPFPNNKIPANRLNKAALNYLNAFPLPNNTTGTGGNVGLSENYDSFPEGSQKWNDFDIRMDWTATSKDNVFVRYSYGQDILTKNSQYPNLPAGYGTGVNPMHPRGEAVGETHTFSANIVNEFRYGHLYNFYGYVPPMDNVPVSADLGILNANRNSLLGGGAAINGGWPEGTYTGDGGPYTVPQSSNQFVDSVSWVKGPHTLKAGASIEKRQVSFFQGNNAKGYFDFSGNNFTGNATSDMLAAFVDDYSIGVASSYFVTQNWETGYYVQDDWKVNHRLTLNLGLRYDLYTFPLEVHNNQSNFNLTTLTLQQAGTNGLSPNVVATNKNNFAPRIGFAYDLLGDGKTSVRGGYGIYYFLDRGGVGNQLSENPDFNGSANYSDSPSQGGWRLDFTGAAPACTTVDSKGNTINAACNAAGGLSLPATQGALPLPVFGATINRADPINANLISVPTNRPTSMIQQWNLQVQRQLNSYTSINVAYVGTSSQHLSNWLNVNSQIMNAAPNTVLYKDAGGTNFGSIDEGLNNGSSNYHGLQLYLNSKMHNGVQYTAAYTWSHAMDNSSAPFSTGTTGAGIFITSAGPDMRDNYGSSDQDQRQVFTFNVLGELPFGRGKMFLSNIPWAINEAIGGWHLNAITTLETGTPITVTTGSYQYTSPTGVVSHPGGGFTNRANLTGKISYPKKQTEWFDTTAFSYPTVLNPNGQNSTFIAPGTLVRNSMSGPGYRDLDASIGKDFPIYDKVAAHFTADAFNLSNTPALTNPDTNMTDGNFGKITSVRANSQRQLQLSLRLTF